MPRLLAVVLMLVAVRTGHAESPPAEPTQDGIELSIWLKNLESDQPSMRERAFDALLSIGPPAKESLPRIVAAIRRRSNNRIDETAVRAALRIDPSGAAALIRELVAANNRTRSFSIPLEFLRRHADELRPYLTMLLKDDNAAVRGEAVRCLMDLGSVARESIPELIDAAKDPLLANRVEIIQAIARLDSTRLADIVEPMIDTMKERGISVSKFGSLLRDHADRTVPLLARRFLSGNETALQDLALALAEFEQRALPYLNEGLMHAQPAIRQASAIALREIPGIAQGSIPLLFLGLDDASPNVRMHAVWTILAIDSRQESEVIPTLVELLACGDFQVQMAAVQQLAELKTLAQPAIPGLLALLEARDRSLRLKSIETLLKIDSKLAPATVSALVRSFREAGDWGRRSADFRLATTLVEEVGPSALPVLPALVKYFAIESRPMRLACVVAALRVSPAVAGQAVPVLCEFLGSGVNSSSSQIQAIRELARLGSAAHAALPELSRFIDEAGDTSLQLEAAVAALIIAPGESAAALHFLRSELRAGGERAGEALQAARRLGGGAAPLEAAIRELAGSRNDVQRRQALELLTQLNQPARRIPAH